MDTKYDIKVKLVGTDGNAFALIGKVAQSITESEGSAEDVKAFMAEAMSGDYNNLLATCCHWVDVM